MKKGVVKKSSKKSSFIKNKVVKNKKSLKPQTKKTFSKAKQVIDTSILAGKKLTNLIEKKGMRGRIIIPDAAVAELEHLANLGKETGFDGLDELAKLHHLKKKYDLKIEFAPPRPTAHEIRYAKSGEIDALIRSLAYGRQAILITSDYIQAKSAAAYGVKVWFIRSRPKKKKTSFSFFGKK